MHTRMPVVLHRRDYARWLERSEQQEGHQLPADLLRPYDAEAMAAAACNPLVGNARNNGQEMLSPPDDPPEDPALARLPLHSE